NFVGSTVTVIPSATDSDFEGDAYLIAAPTHMSFLAQPGTTLAGVPLAAPTGVRVAMLDGGNRLVTDNNATVTLSLVGGTFSNGVTTAAAPVIGGVATFDSLAILAAGNYTLRASAGNLPELSTANFEVDPSATVVGRKLFYKGSTKFDVTNA